MSVTVVTYDEAAQAGYVYLKEGKVARTIPWAKTAGMLNIDTDDAGEILGIEFIFHAQPDSQQPYLHSDS